MDDHDLSPKTAKKQHDILTNALHVFAREGFRSADVQIIADLAGVGKGTVYRHFGNKEQLFLATAKFCLERLAKYVEERICPKKDLEQFVEERGTVELLRQVAKACAEFYQNHPQAIEIMIQERAEFRETVYPTHLMFRAETRTGFDQRIEQGMQRGEIRRGNPQEISDAFSDLLYGSIINGCLEGGRTKLVDRVERAIELLLSGLIAPNFKPVAQKTTA